MIRAWIIVASKERGIDDEPTLHLGPAASALERAGRDGGDRAAINRAIVEGTVEMANGAGSPRGYAGSR